MRVCVRESLTSFPVTARNRIVSKSGRVGYRAQTRTQHVRQTIAPKDKINSPIRSGICYRCSQEEPPFGRRRSKEAGLYFVGESGREKQAKPWDEEYKERARDVSSKMEPGDSSRRNSISRMSHDAFLLIFCEPRVSAIELNINVAQ